MDFIMSISKNRQSKNRRQADESKNWRQSFRKKLSLVLVIAPLTLSAIMMLIVFLFRNNRYLTACALILVFIAILIVNMIFVRRLVFKAIEEQAQELAFQVATLDTLFDSIPDHIFVKGNNLNYLLCNKSLAEYHNRNKEEHKREDVTDLL